MSIYNDLDWRRAFVFWFLLIVENIAFVLSIGYFMALQVSIKSQLSIFLLVGVMFTATFFLGRWQGRPPATDLATMRWRIGPWTSTVVAKVEEYGEGSTIQEADMAALKAKDQTQTTTVRTGGNPEMLHRR